LFFGLGFGHSRRRGGRRWLSLHFFELLIQGLLQLILQLGIFRTNWQDGCANRRRAETQDIF
jgi:hypothetical protein